MPKRKTTPPDDEIKKGKNIRMQPLYEFSIQLLKDSQVGIGGFLSYPYEEDNRFIRLGHCVYACFALDLTGEHEKTRKFYSWALENLKKKENKIKNIVKKTKDGFVPMENELLASTFNSDGSDMVGDIPHNLGDYGALLWGLVEHVHRSGNEFLIDENFKEIENLIDYLSNLWHLPSRDFWNSCPDKIHISTLAQVAGGLNWINAYLMRRDIDETSNEIQSFLWSKFVEEDHLTSSYDALKDKVSGLDATILLLASPFQVVSGEDPILRRTANLIERALFGDENKVSGEKDNIMRMIPAALLLTLYYKSVKGDKNAEKILSWVEMTAIENKILPEYIEKDFILARKHICGVSTKKPSPSILSHALYLIASTT